MFACGRRKLFCIGEGQLHPLAEQSTRHRAFQPAGVQLLYHSLCLLAYARRLLEKLYEPGRRYVKAGVVLDGLEPPGCGQQLSLFAPAAPATGRPAATPESDARARQLMHSLDSLNRQFGRGTVRPAATVAPPANHGQPAAPWLGRAAHRSPAYTTRLEDLMQVS